MSHPVSEEAVEPTSWRQHEGLRRTWLRGRALFPRIHQPTLFGLPLSRIEIGFFGECLSAGWLRSRKRRLLYRNYRGQHRGEVDLVCRHGKALTFVEVKTRTSTAFGRPADAVGPEKQRLIQRGAQDWLRRLGHPDIPIRFDIAEVLLIPGSLPQFHLIENAFSLPDHALTGRTGR